MKTILVVIALFAVTGCSNINSNKAVYENIQNNNRNECTKLPPSDVDECVERSKKSYEDYERERQEVLKK